VKRLLIFLFLIIFLNLLADWNPGDPAKWVQYPDTTNTGLDVSIMPFRTLADDFQCNEYGPIKQIHIWVSFYQDIVPEDLPFFFLAICSDIPANESSTGYSMPGTPIWSVYDPYYTMINYADNLEEGWYDPWEPIYDPEGDSMCFQINFGHFDAPFIQEGGAAAPIIYWLTVAVDPFTGGEIGWKTSLDHWNDDAVWDYSEFRQNWQELIYPVNHPLGGESIDLAFVIEGEEELPIELSSFSAIFGGGSPTLFWTTQSETNNIGWNVYRSESEDLQDCFQINNDLIPGAGTVSTPTDYEYTDEYEVEPTLTYWYWIESVNNLGYTETYGPISLTIPEDGYDPIPPDILDNARLYNTPNPFNPGTTIMFEIDTEEPITGKIRIYDIKGDLVRDLYTGVIPENGVTWDSLDDHGRKVPSGVYIYKLTTDRGNYSKKMVLAK